MKVNNEPAEAGCYIAGHHGQYAVDGLADVCAQFGIEVFEEDTPAYWRRGAEAEDSTESIIVSNGPGKMGSHIARPDECWDGWQQAGNDLEQKLNDLTEGGYWSWEDGGEFFLTQTEVETMLFVVDDDYEAAWAKLVDVGTDAAYIDLVRAKDDAHDEDLKVFEFRTTITYEPE